MNQKRNQIEVSGYIRGSYLRFVISRSAVSREAGFTSSRKGFEEVQNPFCFKNPN